MHLHRKHANTKLATNPASYSTHGTVRLVPPYSFYSRIPVVISVRCSLGWLIFRISFGRIFPDHDSQNQPSMLFKGRRNQSFHIKPSRRTGRTYKLYIKNNDIALAIRPRCHYNFIKACGVILQKFGL